MLLMGGIIKFLYNAGCFNYVWCINGRGRVSTRVSYGPKRGIPCKFISMFDNIMDVGVSSQGTAIYLIGIPWTFLPCLMVVVMGVLYQNMMGPSGRNHLHLLLCLMHWWIDGRGRGHVIPREIYCPKGGIPWNVPCLRHWWMWVWYPKGQLCT